MSNKQITKNQMWVFVLLIGLESIAANLAHPITPTIINNMHLPSYMFGVAYAAMAFSNFLFSPFWAKMIDVISSKKVLLITMVGYALGQGLFMIANSQVSLIIARLVSGLFAGGIYVSFLTYIVNHSSGEVKDTFLTMNATVQTIAGSIGFFIGGFLGVISLKLTFIVQMVGLVTIGILFYLIAQDEKTKPVENFAKAVNPFKAFLDAKSFMNPMFILLFAVVLLASIGTTTFDQNFNYYLKAVLGLSSDYNGVIKGVVGLISLLANLTICLKIIRSGKINKALVWLFFIAFVTLEIAALQTQKWPFLLINLIYFTVNAIYLPLIQGAVANRADEDNQNLVMGFYNSMKSMGMVIGGLTAGFLYMIRPNMPFIIAGVLFLLAAIFMHYCNTHYGND